MNFRDNLLRLSGWLDGAGHLLDSLLELGERVGILLAVGIVAYAVFQLFFSADDPAQTRSGKVLALLNDNWKAALLVILPVFYRSLRALFKRLRQITAGGVGVGFINPTEGPDRESSPEPGSRR